MQDGNFPGIDLELVNELKDTLGTGFIELIDIFLDDSPQHIEEMARCIEDRNLGGVRSAAHILSGSCSNFGASDLVERCTELRNACKEDAEKPLLLDILSKLRTEYGIVSASVKKLGE